MNTKKIVYYHLYACDEEEAIRKTRQEFSEVRDCIIGDAYIDEIWENPRRWCVEVLPRPPLSGAEEKPVDAVD
jgi:hypothetical protein